MTSKITKTETQEHLGLALAYLHEHPLKTWHKLPCKQCAAAQCILMLYTSKVVTESVAALDDASDDQRAQILLGLTSAFPTLNEFCPFDLFDVIAVARHVKSVLAEAGFTPEEIDQLMMELG